MSAPWHPRQHGPQRRWLARWRDGDQLLEDQPSIAHTMPHATDPALAEQLLALRDQPWTSPALSDALKLPISTVTGIPARHGRNRLPVDSPEPPNRHQRRHADEMIHIDINELGRLNRPGHRVHGERTRHSAGAGWEYVHVAVDDASRVAWADVRDSAETQPECVAFLRELVAWYAARGVTLTGVMSDNGPGYTSKAFAAACRQLGLKHYRTRPYRPRTNGKAVPLIRMLCNERAYAVTYSTSADRRRALPAWLHYYNHHRPHGSLDRATPGSRLHALTNASGIYSLVTLGGIPTNPTGAWTTQAVRNLFSYTPTSWPTPRRLSVTAAASSPSPSTRCSAPKAGTC